MAKKKVEESKKPVFFYGKWTLPKDFPEDKVEVLIEYYKEIEKWGEKERSKRDAFNEQFYADLYNIIKNAFKVDSFKGKFKPGELYDEMCETMKEMRKGKEKYSLYDEAKMLQKVMDKHRKKTATKK